MKFFRLSGSAKLWLPGVADFEALAGGMYENTCLKMLTDEKKLLANGQLVMPQTSVRPTVQQSREINCPSCFVSI